jgi:hypothetical protein
MYLSMGASGWTTAHSFYTIRYTIGVFLTDAIPFSI